jgi:hypothetical protein
MRVRLRAPGVSASSSWRRHSAVGDRPAALAVSCDSHRPLIRLPERGTASPLGSWVSGVDALVRCELASIRCPLGADTRSRVRRASDRRNPTLGNWHRASTVCGRDFACRGYLLPGGAGAAQHDARDGRAGRPRAEGFPREAERGGSARSLSSCSGLRPHDPRYGGPSSRRRVCAASPDAALDSAACDSARAPRRARALTSSRRASHEVPRPCASRRGRGPCRWSRGGALQGPPPRVGEPRSVMDSVWRPCRGADVS